MAQQTAGMRTNELLTATPLFRKVVNLEQVALLAQAENPAASEKPLKMVVGPGRPGKKPVPVKVTQVKKAVEKRSSEQESNGDVTAAKKAKQDGDGEEAKPVLATKGRGRPKKPATESPGKVWVRTVINLKIGTCGIEPCRL